MNEESPPSGADPAPSDTEKDTGVFSGDSYLLILFFLLFLMLLALTFYGLCYGVPSVCQRFGVAEGTNDERSRGKCSCCNKIFDMAAYRRERESLRRLREIRRLHRMQQLHLRQRQAYAEAAAIRNSSNATAVGGGAGADNIFNYTPNNIAVFSQIPGPIPHSMGGPLPPGFSTMDRRVLFASTAQPQPHATPVASNHPFAYGNAANMWAAYEQMNSLGFVVVSNPAHSRGRRDVTGDARRRGRADAGGERGVQNLQDMRETLSAEERRAVLESVVVWKPYDAKIDSLEGGFGEQPSQNCVKVPPPDLEQLDTDGKRVPVKEEPNSQSLPPSKTKNDHRVGEVLQETGSENDLCSDDGRHDTKGNSESTTIVFPMHEVPAVPERTCAICLDEFEEGELLNVSNKCPHVFHKECLIMWLDRHDVCPCCRRLMITNSEWREGYEATSNQHSEPEPSTEELPPESNETAGLETDSV